MAQYNINLKRDLRKSLLLGRKSISVKDRQEWQRAIAMHLLKFLPISPMDKVAGYLSVKSEVDISIFTEILWDKSVKYALPKIAKGSRLLEFYQYNKGDKLVKNLFQIAEPEVTQNVNSPKHILPNIVIVPLLGFDEDLNRIGYGGGFYDATIAEYSKNNYDCTFIGVAFEKQKIQQIPTDKLDKKLDAVITEKQIYFNNSTFANFF